VRCRRRRAGSAFLQDCHACDVRRGLPDQQIGTVEFAGVGAEEPECAQRDACGANRDRVHGGEAGGLMIG
jgi:hypothetical protein